MKKTKKIIFVEKTGFKKLPSAETLAVCANGWSHVKCKDEKSALKAAKTSDEEIGLIVSNSPSMELFETFRDQFPGATRVLLTDLAMELYSEQLSNQEEVLLDLIIADRDSNWRTHDLRICLQKIITEDIFGIEKYLSPSSQVHSIQVKNSMDRDTYNNEVMKFADACRLNSHLSKMIWGISEEMLMNAIYDAPATSSKPCYQNISRTDNLTLQPEDYATLSYGCDGSLFIIGSSDPFGTLKKDKLLTYLKKVLKRFDSASIIDTKDGGAGLGLFKILYSCHGIVCNVKDGEKTEIIAFIELDQQIKDFAKMPRSIEYFSN